MAIIVTVTNQKGGVGKTTSVVNLAAFSALSGQRTLVVDCDPQGNASSVLAPDPMGGSVFSDSAPQATSIEGLSVIPSGTDLHDHEKHLLRADGGRYALRHRLERFESDFDLILIDCPPSLSLLPINALYAAQHLVVPIQSEYFAMEGLGQLLASVETIQEEGNHRVNVLGILLTMHDPAQSLAVQVESELRKHFGQQVFQSAIPRDIALAAAPSHGKTILEYDPLSFGGLAYLSATKELLHGLR